MTTPEVPQAPELSPLERVQQLASETLSDAELSRLATWARLTEPSRRKQAESNRAADDAARQSVVAQTWELVPSLKPDFSDTPEGAPAWVQPTNDLASYPASAHVTHGDRTWRNDSGTLILEEPGIGPGWSDVTPVIPDGTRDRPWQWAEGLVVEGGQFVEHQGILYVATIDHTATAETPDQLVGQSYERFN